jgi:hypothetical protein
MGIHGFKIMFFQPKKKINFFYNFNVFILKIKYYFNVFFKKNIFKNNYFYTKENP